MIIKTERLILRKFKENDLQELHRLLEDKTVNKFLPWFPSKTLEDTESFYQSRIKDRDYCMAICLKDDIPIGYIKAETNESHDMGYAIRKEYWNRGIVTEASKSFIDSLRQAGFEYITATHDANNIRSGKIMQKIGMEYKYSYEEFWQPKNFNVIFRMYQLNLDGNKERVYMNYWNEAQIHFI